MITRLVLVKRGCPFCLKAIKAVNQINPKLPDLKSIELKDNYEWEELGFKAHPVMDNLDPKTFDGYPYIYIDGIVVEPAETDHLIIVIGRLVQDDLLTPIHVGDITIG